MFSNLLDLNKTVAVDLFAKAKYPWEVLPKIKDFVLDFGKRLPKEKYNEPEENIFIHEDAEIDPNCRIISPAIICDDAQVRFGAFLRGCVIMGKNTIAGNSSELKNCILFDGVQVPHFNYVGDSIMGFKAHLGAGAIISNVRSDKSNVCVKDKKTINTGMRKFGAIIGDFAEIGCNAVINPGTIIGRNCTVYPMSMVRGILPENSILKNSGDIVRKDSRSLLQN